MQKQVNSLKNVFEVIINHDKSVRYGDILRSGISSYAVDKLIEEYGAKLSTDAEGYTVISA